MTSTTITVTGMTCGHCEAAVKEELGGLPGVSAVAVELNPGKDSPVTITSASGLDESAIRAAVDEAGYQVAAIDGTAPGDAAPADPTQVDSTQAVSTQADEVK